MALQRHYAPEKLSQDGLVFTALLFSRFIPVELQLTEIHFTKQLSADRCGHHDVPVHWSKSIFLPSPSPPSPVTGDEVSMSKALEQLLLPMEDGSTKLLN